MYPSFLNCGNILSIKQQEVIFHGKNNFRQYLRPFARAGEQI
ncbi:hypothetical protein RUMOBE_02345 [Blautia obeum ATCC 29174]|uniref:Uncharacterized protein n=1 Tax=Blautia obeum ATCC 29174 TaxID=411459 RepID=A5ZTL6_9FIRM|nr:hypothetical protein RUMOBE_02345 [Blautia obeum ATCC 29174]